MSDIIITFYSNNLDIQIGAVLTEDDQHLRTAQNH